MPEFDFENEDEMPLVFDYELGGLFGTLAEKQKQIK
jgi:hypothetical protein